MKRSSMLDAGRVLVVDDNKVSRLLLARGLEQQGHRVTFAENGRLALDLLHAQPFDLVLLDVMMPEVDGLEVCRRMRALGDSTPVLMLTARDDESDRLVGLELGADDYVAKPFSPKELVARVRAVLRRSEGLSAQPELVRVGNEVELDIPRMEATIRGRRVDLTRTEFQLLVTLARQPGRIFTRAQLLDAVHGVAFDSYERAIDAHVKNLRRKIEPDPRAPRYLLTAFGVGYRFADLEQ